MGVNKFDMSGECFSRGRKAEDLFLELSVSKDFYCKPSSKSDNIYKHVDFVLEKNSKIFTVDVKARKKTNRFDKSFEDDWIWIELKNVNGRNGWLYGASDFIAFERINDFVLICRKKLIKLVESFNIDKELVSKANLAKYKFYQRRGRKDLSTQIEMSKILKVHGVKIWKKI